MDFYIHNKDLGIVARGLVGGRAIVVPNGQILGIGGDRHVKSLRRKMRNISNLT